MSILTKHHLCILNITVNTAPNAKAIILKAEESADRAPPLVIVAAGRRTAENVSMLDTIPPPSDCTITLTHVACAPVAPVHSICIPADTTPPDSGSVTMSAWDWLYREASSANVTESGSE